MTPNPRENKGEQNDNQQSNSGGNGQDDQTSGDEYEEADIEVSLEEFDSVNNYLDSLNSALDAIEQRNDDLQAQLLRLLQSNREIRQSMKDDVKCPGADGDPNVDPTTDQPMEQ